VNYSAFTKWSDVDGADINKLTVLNDQNYDWWPSDLDLLGRHSRIVVWSHREDMLKALKEEEE